MQSQLSEMSDMSSELLENSSFTARGAGEFLAPMSKISTHIRAISDAGIFCPAFDRAIAKSTSSRCFTEISRDVRAFLGESELSASARISILLVMVGDVAMVGYVYPITRRRANLLWHALIGEEFWKLLRGGSAGVLGGVELHFKEKVASADGAERGAVRNFRAGLGAPFLELFVEFGPLAVDNRPHSV